jgi:hypothetical protein
MEKRARITYNDSNYFQIKLKQTFFMLSILQIIGFRFTRSLIENCRDEAIRGNGWRLGFPSTLAKLLLHSLARSNIMLMLELTVT